MTMLYNNTIVRGQCTLIQLQISLLLNIYTKNLDFGKGVENRISFKNPADIAK